MRHRGFVKLHCNSPVGITHGGRDYGRFEGKITTTGGGMTVEGTFKMVGGDGKYQASPGVAFENKSVSEVDAADTSA